MNYSQTKQQHFLIVLTMILGFAGSATSQSVVNYPGAGVFRAGKLWDSFLPPNVAAYYSEIGVPLRKTLLRIGNFDRAWSTPTHMWPGGWNTGPFWGKGMYMTEFNPDTTWNPSTIGGRPNPSYYPAAGGSYAFASYRDSLFGANNPLRNYKLETRWIDSLNRRQALYEAGFPTTMGVDVRLKIRQFTLNWNNFEDFLLVEMKLINTGAIDMNADGIPERTNNVIRALTLLSHGEPMHSYSIGRNGVRSNRLGAKRAMGYVGDNDPLGYPWDMLVTFPGESVTGIRDLGLNDWPSRFYTDVWSGWSWLAVKRGGRGDSIAVLPDKNTLYGTHPIGLGLQRGWFASAGQGRGIGGIGAGSTNPKNIHTVSMGVWYLDGGKTRNSNTINLSPDPNFFVSGTTGDPTTFVPRAASSRPRGDRKLVSEEIGSAGFEVSSYEPWTKGFTAPGDFDGDMFSGIGPFSLAVAETITVVWAEASGYRFRGIANAIAAARWAYEHNLKLPETPAVPDLQVFPSAPRTARVFWDSAAESHLSFAGYKIYRVSSDDSISWLQGGMREMDRYWMNNFPGPIQDSLLQPVNPNFVGQSNRGVPNSWGPYKLIARIPEQNLAAYRDTSQPGFSYSYADSGMHPGSETWYYVAAYTNQQYDLGPSYSGYNSPTINSIETSSLNRNGASGLWLRTYPFATLSPYYPTTPRELKQIGAPVQIVTGISDGAALVPLEYSLDQNFPNPFNPSTTINYQLPTNNHVTLKVFDILGREVATLVDGVEAPGYKSVTFDARLRSANFGGQASGLASGVYFYRLEAGGFTSVKKMVAIK